MLRGLPAEAALPLARAGGLARWALRPQLRAAALAHMSRAVAGGGRDGDERSLAFRHVVAMRTLELLVWRPELASRGRVSGDEALRSLRAGGEGAVVLFTHLCLSAPGMYVLAAAGLTDAVVYNTDPQPGAQQLMYQRVFGGWGVDLVPRVSGAFEELRARLERGQTCAIAGDLPGGSPCVFLGRRAGLASGPARLARLCDVPIVFAVPTLRRARVDVALTEVVRPDAFPDEAALVQRLADLMSAAILSQPQTWQDHEWMARLWAGDEPRP